MWGGWKQRAGRGEEECGGGRETKSCRNACATRCQLHSQKWVSHLQLWVKPKGGVEKETAIVKHACRDARARVHARAHSCMNACRNMYRRTCWRKFLSFWSAFTLLLDALCFKKESLVF